MDLPGIWFLAIAFLFLGYFVLEGFDFGVGMLMSILGRSETRRRVLLNTIGPVWDGNEVWLITAVGALFAAFPEWYATMLSGFYLPVLVIVLGLIARVCAIEWRGKIDDPRWRRACDIGIGLGSWLPALLWGFIFAAIVGGLPINAERQMTGGLFGSLSWYAGLGALAFAALFFVHGLVFVALKTAGEVHDDAVAMVWRVLAPAVAVIGAFVLWTQWAHGNSWTWWAVGLVGVGLAGGALALRHGRDGWAFVGTFLATAALIVLIFGCLHPAVMPSSTDPAFSLTITNSASSAYTLTVLSWCALIAGPIVMIYQGWTYWVFRQRISTSQIPKSIGLPLGERV